MNTLKELNTAEPERIKNFHKSLHNLKWSEEERLQSLKAIFDALHTLASGSLEYYNSHREKSKVKSRWSRNVSIILGAIGAIFIALQNVALLLTKFSIQATDMAAFGSVCLIVAATLLAYNKYLCVSDSHIRYVVAQFDLGKAIVEFELDWQKWLNENSVLSTDMNTKGAFDLFNEFSELIYKTISDDTKRWGDGLKDALNEMLKNSGKHSPKE